ncbi:aerobic C4-dicarboxylate transport protein [Variibacter gotjawalensis]|uniref:C4-dicarboxylate transport protein n=1 Tax=Variibacter gotjawalensis TaxID=1333996 RepID=A0A0S3PTT2_9BRAD|nr:dicarboxylate/amino acid:cation symporter [Variibacter gotjawalensis]NIK49676.1 aerobic C4-dicarboxylate transport protein [Variibacter gotjawalensis]RZS45688.1 aerobic C4-dicarboxylate transport protein [Variibacter gotjawalensis]BAT59359.1 aerobic C4-dicarboxylate transport protein [Variibacter gotjawalensis]
MATATATTTAPGHTGPWFTHLYVQVLGAITLGILLGHFYPSVGEQMKPLGDAFIKAIKMVIAPIIFVTVVHGIASMRDMKKVGRVGLKALIYFEIVTTLALVVGLLVVNLWKPGVGLNVDLSSIDTKSIAAFTTKAKEQGTIQFLMDIIPATVVGAFANGEILQVLFFAILFAFALQSLGSYGESVLHFIDVVSHVFFKIVGIIMKVAPIGAFGAMAFTIGKYGVGTLLHLGNFMLSFYTTCLIFVFVVLGSIAALCGFSIIKFIRYIKEELLIVLGTSSSESVLPRMLAKMENLGCEKSVVGLVIPTGYSFNLDGTCIYLTMAAIFLAQATGTPLTIAQELGIIGVLLLTSKGAAGVTGSGFIVLAATLASVGTIPVASIALILGIDRFMSEARALTNLVGNGLATVVVSKWEGALDEVTLHKRLNGETDAEADTPEDVMITDEERAEGARRPATA